MKNRLCFMVAVLAVVGAGISAEVSPRGVKKPPVWAVYYAWYDLEALKSKGKYNLWQWEPATNVPSVPRSKAVPLIGYYDSRDKDVVRWHMQCAKAAGVDAFLVSWWGGANVSGKAFEQVILPAAEAEQFKVAMCSELAQFHGDTARLAREMGTTLKRMTANPFYLRVEGKPVVYLYQVPYDPTLTIERFGILQRGIEAETGPIYWLFDKVTNAGNKMNIPKEWLAVPEIQMFGFYGTFSIKREWKYDRLLSDYTRVVNAAHAAGKKICVPAHPGHDNSGFRPDDYFVMPRDNGETLRGYLRLATDAGADAIMLTSFNEWPETTVVVPSSSWADPYQYLKILAEWKGKPFASPPPPVGIISAHPDDTQQK
jgi:hypothetical protein